MVDEGEDKLDELVLFSMRPFRFMPRPVWSAPTLPARFGLPPPLFASPGASSDGSAGYLALWEQLEKVFRTFT